MLGPNLRDPSRPIRTARSRNLPWLVSARRTSRRDAIPAPKIRISGHAEATHWPSVWSSSIFMPVQSARLPEVQYTVSRYLESDQLTALGFVDLSPHPIRSVAGFWRNLDPRHHQLSPESASRLRVVGTHQIVL